MLPRGLAQLGRGYGGGEAGWGAGTDAASLTAGGAGWATTGDRVMALRARQAARIAAWKAKDAAEKAGWSTPRTIGSAVASDAFFPFADGLLAAVEAGATAVIQPGGSIRDDEVIAAAQRTEETMLALALDFGTTMSDAQMAEFVASLSRPRKIMLMVKAVGAVMLLAVVVTRESVITKVRLAESEKSK